MINDDFTEYLKGDKFSSGNKFRVSESETSILYKHELLPDLIRGKKVIHFGCIDHVAIIDEKIKQNKWLHKLLMENSEICYGIDIDRPGIDLVKKMGIEGIFCCDIESDELPLEIRTKKWDYLVMGDVLEHVDNPVNFLTQVKIKFEGIADRVIITVPNAFRFENWFYSLLNKEYINSDHRYWFTPFTLGKVCTRAALSIEKIEICNSRNPASRYFFMRYLLKKRPMLRDTCLIICRMGF